MTVTEATKRDKTLFILFLIGVIVLVSVTVYLMEVHGISMMFFVAAIHTAVAIVLLCMLLIVRIPIGPSKIGMVYSDHLNGPVPVTVSITKYIPFRKPLKILVDGRKVADIYGGKELQVLMPEGTHEISVCRHKDVIGVRAMEIQEGMELFLWQDISKNPLPFQIVQVSGDKAVLEERARLGRRSGTLFILPFSMFFAIVSAILWAIIIF